MLKNCVSKFNCEFIKNRSDQLMCLIQLKFDLNHTARGFSKDSGGGKGTCKTER